MTRCTFGAGFAGALTSYLEFEVRKEREQYRVRGFTGRKTALKFRDQLGSVEIYLMKFPWQQAEHTDVLVQAEDYTDAVVQDEHRAEDYTDAVVQAILANAQGEITQGLAAARGSLRRVGGNERFQVCRDSNPAGVVADLITPAPGDHRAGPSGNRGDCLSRYPPPARG